MIKLIIRRIVLGLSNFKDWIYARIFFSIIAVLKLFPAESTIWFCDEAARGIGKLFPRTRIARKNLQLAFPEKCEADIDQIINDMWGNMGRLVGEYVYLDQIFELNEEDQSKGRVEVTGVEHFENLKAHEGTAICFTAHTGNWEILPIAAAAYDLTITALFRPPNNRYVGERVLSARTTNSGHLVPSKAGASWALANVMDDGGKVGILVDQFFNRGHLIKFFGRETLANPLLAKLARQYECPIYPARCVRLPNSRFRIEIEKPIQIPKDTNGNVDTALLTQQINDVVERWVREYPEQWLWLHKRWRPDFMEIWHKNKARKKRAS